MKNRRRFVVGLALLAVLAVAGASAVAWKVIAASDSAPLSAAVGFLEHEKSAAEQYAVVLATVGKSDQAQYVHGILLYADAKAEFDGLIAQLKFDLVQGNDPTKSTKFAEALRGAAEKRVAFTSFVLKEVEKGSKGALPDVLEVVPDLIKAITDAGLAIWSAFRDADKDQRDTILNEIEHLQWKSFSDLAK